MRQRHLVRDHGEGPSISQTERRSCLSALEDAGIEGQRTVIGVTANSAGDALDQTLEALERRARNVLLAPPSWFSDVSDEGVFDWYAGVINQLGGRARDLILYNIPSLTGVTLGLSLIAKLRNRFPTQIVGIKDSSCDWAFTEPLLNAHGDLMILVGDERDLVSAIGLGGSGSICGVANIYPATPGRHGCRTG